MAQRTFKVVSRSVCMCAWSLGWCVWVHECGVCRSLEVFRTCDISSDTEEVNHSYFLMHINTHRKSYPNKCRKKSRVLFQFNEFFIRTFYFKIINGKKKSCFCDRLLQGGNKWTLWSWTGGLTCSGSIFAPERGVMHFAHVHVFVVWNSEHVMGLCYLFCCLPICKYISGDVHARLWVHVCVWVSSIGRHTQRRGFH